MTRSSSDPVRPDGNRSEGSLYAPSTADDRIVSPLSKEARDAIADRLADLRSSAIEVAQFAGLSVEPGEHAAGLCMIDPAKFDSASDWQRALALQGAEDIAAMLRPGLRALRMLAARGRDPIAPARALLCEFAYAQDSLMRIAPPREGPSQNL